MNEKLANASQENLTELINQRLEILNICRHKKILLAWWVKYDIFMLIVIFSCGLFVN